MPYKRGKILVIDDLPDWREMISGLLKEAGYGDVQTAANIDEAMHLLRQQPYHIAIVDLRLDERDELNEDGLLLAKRMKEYFPELAIIILTGYANIGAVRQALQPQDDGQSIAFNFLEKEEVSKLLDAITQAFVNSAKVNPQLKIELTPPLSWDTIQTDIIYLHHLSDEAIKIEVTDLLQRIFYKAQHITIKMMKGGLSGSTVVLVTPIINNIPQTKVVVKFNQREKAKKESQNYDTYVANHIEGARRTQRLNFRETARLGGIAYSFIGATAAEFQRFNEIYTVKKINIIKMVIENLFKETCRTWYVNTLQSSDIPHALGPDYKKWLNLDNKRLTGALTNLVEHVGDKILSFNNHRHPNQSDLLLKPRGIKLSNPLPLSRAAFAYTGPYCFTHGDLHEGNILVDGYNQTWLIDFYQTGLGHPVRDFAMLESAIKFSLQQSDCPLHILYEWERNLLYVDDLDTPFMTDISLQLDAELSKATDLILHIRSILHEILPQMTLRDYQISLYFHALKALLLTKKFTERQRLHTLISAALLTEVLQ